MTQTSFNPILQTLERFPLFSRYRSPDAYPIVRFTGHLTNALPLICYS